MKYSLLFRMVVLVTALMCTLGTSAQEAYAVYTSDNTTLTFYYDNDRSTHTGTAYDLNNGPVDPGWVTDFTNLNVKQVVFDPSFEAARPTTTYAWFYGMNNIDTIIGLEYLNTSEVTNMNWMFGHSKNLEHIDVSHFNTDKVTSMYAMFGDCEKLKTLDLSNWNTANVTDMDMMFSFCLELQTVYVGSGWNTDCVTESEHMFANNFLLVGGQGTAWDASNPRDKTYAHIDGGTGNPGYLTDKFNPVAYAVFENTTLTFYYDFERNSRSGKVYELNTGSNFPAWNDDGITGIVNYAVFDPSFADARPTSTHGWFIGMQFLKSIKGLEYLNTSEVTNMGDMFHACSQLTSIDVSHFNTEKVTFMAGMFSLCSKLKSLDMSSFNTANVFTMRFMFYNCGELETIYVGDGWTTAAATGNNYQMFQDCNSLVGGQGTTYDPNHTEEDYAHLDGGPDNPGYFSLNDVVEIPQVIWCEDNTTLYFINSETMYDAGDTYDGQIVTNVWSGSAVTATPDDDPDFNTTAKYYCTRVVFDESFAAVRPTSCYGWFDEFEHLSVIEGIENLNTSKVTDMAFMFCDCENLTVLDLSNFNTAKVNQLFFMFYGCYKLQTIYVGDGWILSDAAIEISENVFNSCNRLVGGKGTAYDVDHVDADYAHIDGGPDNPGYFTEKPSFILGDVNGDFNVDITDVTALIDLLLGGGTISNPAADCNHDNNVTIADVTALIDYLLSGAWPAEP